MKFNGKAHVFGDDVDTDAIIPARYLVTIDPKELAEHCMEDSTDPEFPKKVQPGDVIVAGKNFGCGSSRQHAPIAIKGADVSVVIAKSFARIFYRNCINMGMPIIECPEAVEGIAPGDTLEVDVDAGVIRNTTKGSSYTFKPFPPFVKEIMAAGGLIPYISAKKKGVLICTSAMRNVFSA